MIEYRTIRVGLLGAGSVGSQVARLLLEHSEELTQRIGARIELVGIAVRDTGAKRDTQLPPGLLTTDAESLILGSDIVIELMGGIEPARTLVLAAIASGADVVTGNKALLANHGPELFAAAEQVGAQLSYEAAVAGAIPIIRPLRDSLAGDRIDRILGIVNGTTNFILDRMDTTGASLEDALATATELGYAEALRRELGIRQHDQERSRASGRANSIVRQDLGIALQRIDGSHIRAYGARPTLGARPPRRARHDGEHAWVTAPAGTLTVRLYVCRHQPFVP